MTPFAHHTFLSIAAVTACFLLLGGCHAAQQDKKKPSQPAIGIALPELPVLRINVDQEGKGTCIEDTPVIFTIVDDIKNDRVIVTQTTTPPSPFGPKIDHYSSSALRRVEVVLCGSRNSFTYKLAASNTSLSVPREFKIKGSAGFDYVMLDFYTNGSGHHVTIESPVSAELELGAGSDQVEVKINKFNGSDFRIAADLGPGHDSFSLITQPMPMTGSVAIRVEGKEGNDSIFLDLYDNADFFVIPQDGSVRIDASGDTLDQFGLATDNVADHGSDRIVTAFRGTVHGSLQVALYGDDTITRLKDLQCSTPACVFYCQCDGPCPPPFPGSAPVCTSPKGLEKVLKNNPAYANDTVKLKLDVQADSTGVVDALVDGGVSSDGVVLVMNNESNQLSSYKAVVSGGQPHHFKSDACFATPTAVGNSSAVHVEHCDQILSDPGPFD